MGSAASPACTKADRGGRTASVIANPGLRFARCVSLGDRSMLALAAVLPGLGVPLIFLMLLCS
jgi:hypothetical protein